MNWVCVTEEEQQAGRIFLDDRRARHLIDVLKVTVGQRVRVVVENRSRGEGMVLQADQHAVLLDYREKDIPARPMNTLILAPPRPKVMRRLWLHLPGLDLRRVFVVAPRGTPPEYFATHWLQPEIYLPLLREGLEQAGTPWLPEVHIHKGFGSIVETFFSGSSCAGERLVAHPGVELSILRAIESPVPGGRTVAIGPERGWTDVELELLRKAGFVCVTLGNFPLRSDAACIAALALLAIRNGNPVAQSAPCRRDKEI